MARLIKLDLEVFPPSEFTDEHCVEIYEQIRMGSRNRICHFGFKPLIEAEDVNWVSYIFGNAFESAIMRTVGVSQKLQF